MESFKQVSSCDPAGFRSWFHLNKNKITCIQIAARVNGCVVYTNDGYQNFPGYLSEFDDLLERDGFIKGYSTSHCNFFWTRKDALENTLSSTVTSGTSQLFTLPDVDKRPLDIFVSNKKLPSTVVEFRRLG